MLRFGELNLAAFLLWACQARLMVEIRLILLEFMKEYLVFQRPRMLNNADTVEFNASGWLGGPLLPLTSWRELVKELRFQNQPETSILPIMKGVIDDLDIALVLNIFKFICRQSHDCGPLLPVEVDKDRFGDICQLRWEHVGRYAVLISLVAIGAAPAHTLFDYLPFAVVVWTCQVVGLVIVFQDPDVRTNKIVLVGKGLKCLRVLLVGFDLLQELPNEPLILEALVIILLLLFLVVRLAVVLHLLIMTILGRA